MMRYKDKTFCCARDCKCGRKLTAEEYKKALEWWGENDPPIAFSNFCSPNKEPLKVLIDDLLTSLDKQLKHE